ncbi:hypothetical protein BDZ85DRAFT_257504 [Elsinoe ampelina]|uniref:Uncharacterized protein n=1 Tax=Elsinoe ampelina TaxID=302913 RepID=A0A6A6GI88_9PEZI|nr:hypothetical protein BDZ85DRAFT_257504 [Elsinoe ampelina]
MGAPSCKVSVSCAICSMRLTPHTAFLALPLSASLSVLRGVRSCLRPSLHAAASCETRVWRLADLTCSTSNFDHTDPPLDIHGNQLYRLKCVSNRPTSTRWRLPPDRLKDLKSARRHQICAFGAHLQIWSLYESSLFR